MGREEIGKLVDHLFTWSTNCRWPRFAEEAKNGAEAEKEFEGTKKFCWLDWEVAGLNSWEGLKEGGGVLFGLNADRNTSELLPPSTFSARLSRLSLKAGKRVSGVKSEGAGQLRPLSPLGSVPLSSRFFAALLSHGKPTLTSRPEGRRELLNIYKDVSLRFLPCNFSLFSSDLCIYEKSFADFV